ncbi:VOC family protein [bacterium]|nr:VOC family protein [bacterium]MBU1676733.1 VOC family protein [bacterium]
MTDLGLTHIALPVTDLDRSIDFYAVYAGMEVVHRRAGSQGEVAWISDRTRPFVVVLIERASVDAPLLAPGHLGVALSSRAEVDLRCDIAREEGVLVKEPEQAGPPVGYRAVLRDPDGHTVELTYGQQVGLTVAGEEEA